MARGGNVVGGHGHVGHGGGIGKDWRGGLGVVRVLVVIRGLVRVLGEVAGHGGGGYIYGGGWWWRWWTEWI